MKVKIRRKLVQTDQYVGRKGKVIEVPDYIGAAWCAAGHARKVADVKTSKGK